MDTMLQMLKTDLGILSSTAYDARFRQLLSAAMDYIAREGVKTLNPEDTGDAQLIVMVAAWLWRRRDNPEAMSRGLRLQLNNRKFQETAGEGV